MTSLVGLEQLGNIRHQRIIRIGIGEERTNRKQNFRNGQCWTPLIFQNIQANATVRVNVAMINAGGEMHFRRLSLQKNVVLCCGSERDRKTA
jgi:hypothetical protein